VTDVELVWRPCGKPNQGVGVKLGLITDIHEHVPELEQALAELDRHGADRILCIGDVVERGNHLHETAAILAQRRIAGVWGNHDFGLCSHPSAMVSTRRREFVGPVLDYFATYQPFLEIEDCWFSHVEPWRDLNDVMGLWYFEGIPNTPEKVARSFDACGQRVMFTGHMHRWLVARRDGVIHWDGVSPIKLEPPERFLVVVAAVCDGWCAIYDTQTFVLTPIELHRVPGETASLSTDVFA